MHGLHRITWAYTSLLGEPWLWKCPFWKSDVWVGISQDSRTTSVLRCCLPLNSNYWRITMGEAFKVLGGGRDFWRHLVGLALQEMGCCTRWTFALPVSAYSYVSSPTLPTVNIITHQTMSQSHCRLLPAGCLFRLREWSSAARISSSAFSSSSYGYPLYAPLSLQYLRNLEAPTKTVL